MTTKLLETLTLAEEALHNMQNALLFVSGGVKDYSTSNMTADANDDADKALAAIREAKGELEKQEPVAWITEWNGEYSSGKLLDYVAHKRGGKVTHTPLYAAPVRTKDLTDDEIVAVGYSMPYEKRFDEMLFARAVIAADREKNK